MPKAQDFAPQTEIGNDDIIPFLKSTGPDTWLESRIPKPSLSQTLGIIQVSTVSIPEGVDNWSVTGQAWPSIPVVFGLMVLKPDDGLQLYPTLVDGTTTIDGFEVWLNGVTDGPGYKLRFGYVL